jgi:hypothetical protein
MSIGSVASVSSPVASLLRLCCSLDGEAGHEFVVVVVVVVESVE